MASGMAECPCCAPPWAFGRLPPSWTHLKLAANGTDILWQQYHGARVRRLAMSTISDHVYLSSDQATNNVDQNYFRKLRLSDGVADWNKSSGSALLQEVNNNAIAVDPSGNIVYVPSSLSTAAHLRKLQADSTVVWDLSPTINNSSPVTGLACDSSDNIYLTYNSGNGVTRALSSSGSILWTALHGTGAGNVTNVATNSTHVCSVGARSTTPFRTTRVFDMSGSLLWTADHGTLLFACAYMSNGNLVTVGNRDSVSGKTTRCYDPSGVELWSADHGTAVTCVAIDTDDNVYTGGTPISGVTTRKYDKDGVPIWTHDYSLGKGGGGMYAIAVDSQQNVYCAGEIVFS